MPSYGMVNEEQRIRDLCLRVAATMAQSEELEKTIRELKSSIAETDISVWKKSHPQSPSFSVTHRPAHYR
jgi:hypothetical protein